MYDYFIEISESHYMNFKYNQVKKKLEINIKGK